jgi:hypothetical protein
VLHVERAHEVVHLVVLVNDVALEVPHVERLALEREADSSLDSNPIEERTGAGRRRVPVAEAAALIQGQNDNGRETRIRAKVYAALNKIWETSHRLPCHHQSDASLRINAVYL